MEPYLIIVIDKENHNANPHPITVYDLSIAEEVFWNQCRSHIPSLNPEFKEDIIKSRYCEGLRRKLFLLHPIPYRKFVAFFDDPQPDMPKSMTVYGPSFEQAWDNQGPAFSDLRKTIAYFEEMDGLGDVIRRGTPKRDWKFD